MDFFPEINDLEIGKEYSNAEIMSFLSNRQRDNIYIQTNQNIHFTSTFSSEVKFLLVDKKEVYFHKVIKGNTYINEKYYVYVLN